ncbi:MAG TPA: hypothetical protein VK662_15040 [Acidothermaceae bacterium]|jgi:hypothetical protein|nr:hypothetical protein [Acidothermaceae bacterium]
MRAPSLLFVLAISSCAHALTDRDYFGPYASEPTSPHPDILPEPTQWFNQLHGGGEPPLYLWSQTHPGLQAYRIVYNDESGPVYIDAIRENSETQMRVIPARRVLRVRALSNSEWDDLVECWEHRSSLRVMRNDPSADIAGPFKGSYLLIESVRSGHYQLQLNWGRSWDQSLSPCALTMVRLAGVTNRLP